MRAGTRSRRVLTAAAVACAAVMIRAAPASSQAPAAGGRGPAYRLIELPSGRVLAESRPDLLAAPTAPGSIVKLATLLAAVESGIVDEQTRISCRRQILVDGKRLTCVHPDLHRPLSAAEALGHSCNVFFATVAQRLPRQSLDAALVRLGLPPADPDAPTASAALGLRGVRARPPQLLEAFLRLVGLSPREVALPAAAARILRAGTELAARSGTASALAASGLRGLAKTGTAPMPGGGAAGLVTAAVDTELPLHAIVVLVPGGAGSDAAVEAARILVRHGAPQRHGEPMVRVGVARRDGRGYDIVTTRLEDYVAQVVTGEMGGSGPSAALEAMAITARTFALANMGRHRNDGFDLCDLTHCQVLARPTAAADAAARATAGLVLTAGTAPADVYYSSSCGGHTETPSRVWTGARDWLHLPARPDPACAGEPAWTTEIPEPQLRRVLAAAGLKGDAVTRFAVASRHPSGRANLLAAEGLVPDRIAAEAFRAAAGRVLGWQRVKSTLFEVTRSGAGYVLAGRGSGHGVGLCVRGAIARGRAGGTRDEILSAYFPGLRLRKAPGQTEAATLRPAREARMRIVVPEADRAREPDIRAAARRALNRVASALGVEPPAELDLVFHPTVESFARATGQPWWTAARTSGSRIDLLPPRVLEGRRTLESTLRHEFVHLLTEPVLAGRALWIREGLAVVVAGELPSAGADARGRGGARAAACPSDEDLRAPRDPDAWRRAYEAAGRCVSEALAGGRRWQDLR